MQKRGAKFFVLLVIFTFCFSAFNAKAQVFSQTQAFNFGEWLIAHNNPGYFITVQANGAYSSSPQLIMLSPPTPGIYAISGLPPFAVISSVDVVMSQTLDHAGSESFTMDNFQSIIPNADASGHTTLRLGARAVTSGNSIPYADGVYNGVLDVTINL